MNISELIIAALLACPNLQITREVSADLMFQDTTYQCHYIDGLEGITIRLVYFMVEKRGDCVLDYALTGGANRDRDGAEFLPTNQSCLSFTNTLQAKVAEQARKEREKRKDKAIKILQKVLK